MIEWTSKVRACESSSTITRMWSIPSLRRRDPGPDQCGRITSRTVSFLLHIESASAGREIRLNDSGAHASLAVLPLAAGHGSSLRKHCHAYASVNYN